MAGWGRLVVGAAIGAVGALYATNEEFRKNLPAAAQNLPVAVRDRFVAAREAARQAASARRAEILRELEAHGGDHVGVERRDAVPAVSASPVAEPDGAGEGDDTVVLEGLGDGAGRVGEGVPETERSGEGFASR